MARKLRVEYPGAVYHVINRGEVLDCRAGGAAAQGDAHKVEIARRLRQETTMPLRWIAQRLNMGAAGSLANLLRPAK